MTFSPTSMTKEDGDLVMQSLYSGRIPRIVRRGSEHSLLTCSLQEGANEGNGSGGKDKKSKMADRFKPGKKTKKKSDTFSGRGSSSGRATPSLLSSPVRSGQFVGSPTHSSINPSASFTSSDFNKTPVKKSKWTNIRQRMGKKFNRSSSTNIEATEELNRLRVKPQRSQSIPSNRKCGVYGTAGGRSASITVDDVIPNLTDGGAAAGCVGGGSVSLRGRRSSSSHCTNSVNLVAKIFSVLGCWVDEYFEVSLLSFCCAVSSW